MRRPTVGHPSGLAIIPLLVAVILLRCPWTAAATTGTLTVLSVNDVYEITAVQGWGGMAELMTLLAAERATASHHLTTVNGDFLSPSLMSALFKGAQMVDLLNAVGVDVVVFGNHEFDFGPEVLRQRMQEARFAWLGSNVFDTDGQPFGGALATMTRQVGEFTVGLFGLVTPETATLSSPGPQVTIAPIVPTARAAMETLRQAGAEVIIALTHLSLAEDRELARQVAGIHVILGGHEHDPITWYEGNTLIHKSGYDARYLGRIDIRMEKLATPQGGQVVVTPSWRMMANRQVRPDPDMAARVARYTTRLRHDLAQPLGRVVTTLDSQRSAVRTRETTMGNLVADALRQALQADVALINGGGIRGDRLYPAGTELTREDILRELPFGNVGVLIELSGAELFQALEHGVSQVEAQAGRFPQTSGMQIVYDPRLSPGSRIVQVRIHDQPLVPASRYRVATHDYLLKGGDGYQSFGSGKVLIDASGGMLLSTLVMQYIAAHSPLAPTMEGRMIGRNAP